MAQYPYPGINLELQSTYPSVFLRDQTKPHGYDARTSWEESDEMVLPLRELFMLALMNTLTDKPGWHRKVFDDTIVQKWRKEALEQPERGLYNFFIYELSNEPYHERTRQEWREQSHSRSEVDESEEVEDSEQSDELEDFGDLSNQGSSRGVPSQGMAMSEDFPSSVDEKRLPFPQSRFLSDKAFEFCIRELRAKASHYERTGLVPVLDTLGRSSKPQFDIWLQHMRTSRACGRAVVKSDLVVGDGLRTRLRDIFTQLRVDQVSSGLDWHPGTDEKVLDLLHPSLYPFVYGRSIFIQDEVVGVKDAVDAWAGKGMIWPHEPKRWMGVPNDNCSKTYQWLPANVVFKDGCARFSSYINNLHPEKYVHVYQAIEELVDLAIPAWDQVLGDYGRLESRFSIPVHDDYLEDAAGHWDPGHWEEMDPVKVAACPLEPSLGDLEKIAYQVDWSQCTINGHGEDPLSEDFLKGEDKKKYERIKELYPEEIDRWKWREIRDAIYPEPDGTPEVDYTCHRSIREIFHKSGLQIYVKMARIELTPEKPDFPVGGWHVEGMLNERICATFLYYLDSDNITTSCLDFRTKVQNERGSILRHEQDNYNWLERVYGRNFEEGPCLQYYGRVETREGRVLAFPNSFQHRVTPFSLKDRTKPGHRSFIALWLVDPARRVVSTANVPPQQLDWWTEATFGRDKANLGTMPPEIVQLLLAKPELADVLHSSAKERAQNSRFPSEIYDMLRKESTGAMSGLMSLDEAKEHRVQLVRERSQHTTKADSLETIRPFNFCEH